MSTELAPIVEKLVELVRHLEFQRKQPEQEWFSIKQAAVLTGLSAKHIRRAVINRLIPCSNVGTPDRATYRVHRRDIEEWMERCRQGALPQPKRGRKPAKQESLVPPPNRHYRPNAKLEALLKEEEARKGHR